MDELRRLAEPLQGKRVVHLSATAFGGGVAEINYTLVPLMADAGLEVEWRIIKGADEFFEVTKTIHNGLQGDPLGLTAEQKETSAGTSRERRRVRPGRLRLRDRPRPAARGMIDHFPDTAVQLDLALPHRPLDAEPACFDVLLPSLGRYDAAIFHLREYVPTRRVAGRCIWPPAIDPLTPKNMALSTEDAAYIVDQFGIDVGAAAPDAGLPLRPLEGPARRHRRLPAGQGAASRSCSSRSSARWPTTTPRAGTTTTRRSTTRTATRTSSSSRT